MFLGALLGSRAQQYDPIHPRDPALVELFGGGASTSAGQSVTEESALRLSAVYACVRIISETVAMLPLIVYRGGADGDRQPAREHPAYWLLKRRPNPEQTSMSFRELMQACVLLWGNAYAEIVRDGAGRPRELWWLHPRRVQPSRTRGGRLVYEVKSADGQRASPAVVPAADMLHIPGLGFDGVTGKSVIAYARDSLGLGLAAENFGSKFYGEGGRPSGVLKHPNVLGDTAADNFRRDWKRLHQNPDHPFEIAILEEGMEYQAIGMPNNEAQFLETREFQLTEVCRWFRMQPHKVADLKRATFSNIEEQNRDFVQDAILPWNVRSQQEYERKLLRDDERDDLFIEHVVEGLLRADIVKRYQSYATARQWGWLNVNTIRRLENLNSIGPQGEIYLIPGNMTNAADPPVAVADPADPPPPADDPTDVEIPTDADPPADPPPDDAAATRSVLAALRVAQHGQLAEAYGRMLHKESQEIRQAARDFRQFGEWLARFYAPDGRWAAKWRSALAPGAAALLGLGQRLDVDAVLDGERAYSARKLNDLAGRHTADDFPAAVEELLGQWAAARPQAFLHVLKTGDLR